MTFETYTFSQLIDLIQANLINGLPGKAGQYKLAPSFRPNHSKEKIQDFNPKIGGVLALLYPKNNDTYIVFIERNVYDGVHSGQISFPGGKEELDDNSIIETALREANEEVGIIKDDVKVITQLTDLYIPPSNFLVYPTLGFINYTPTFLPDPLEVNSILEIPISKFIGTINIKEVTIERKGSSGFKVPAYVIDNNIIWGATAIIMSELACLIEGKV